jgi:predicted AAA+ superfamily ATPase
LGIDPQLYFFRDSQGNEVDLIFKSGNQLIPLEVKAAKTFNNEFLKNLHFFKKLVGDRCKEEVLIYAGEQEQKIGSCKILNYSHASEAITSQARRSDGSSG